jgi:hypothetical protein
MTLGDALTLCGLVVAFALYVAQRSRERRREVDTAVSLLEAAAAGIRPWGDLYFGGDGYDEARAKKRGQEDVDAVLAGSHSQVLHVPVELGESQS